METTRLTFNVPTFTRMHTKNCSFTIRLTNILLTCVLLSSVMTCVRAAPSPKVLHFPPQAQVPHSNYDDNPCGVDIIVPKALRHSGSIPSLKVLKNLEHHLKTTLNDFNHLNKSKISIQYKDSMNMTKHFVDKYLPKKQLAEYRIFKKNHPLFNQQQMVEHILVDLRGKLKFYGKAFHELSIKAFNTHSSSFSTSERTSILKVLGAKLRALSCEVETGINATNSVVPAVEDSAFAKVGTNWPKNPDTTAIMTLDMSTFALYKTFLQDWVQVQRDVKALNHKKRTRTTKSSNKRRPGLPNKGKRSTKIPKLQVKSKAKS